MIPLQRHLWRNCKHFRNFTTAPVMLSNKDDNQNENQSLNEEGNKILEEGQNIQSKRDEVTNKLNDLLAKMIQEIDKQPTKVVTVTQAVKKVKVKEEKPKPLGKRLEEAAKEVAKSLGGDVEKTESELLKSLLQRSEPSPGLNTVLANIKVEKTESRAEQVRSSLKGRLDDKPHLKPDAPKKYKKKTDPTSYVDILGAEPTTYFKDMKPQPASCLLRTWNSCLARDMKLAITHPPANIYEQMIQWTDKGMLWHFPIDNFQGLEDEKQVPFEEHIFLDQHLEDWCPEKGPVRQFMELVCLGLSKNYWLTVEEKKAHIMWFRDYFADKKTLMKELGAGDIQVEAGHTSDLFETIKHPKLM